MSALRRFENGRDANRCLPVFLWMHGLWHDAEAEGGRLLRVLFLRVDTVSAYSGPANRW